MIAKFRIAVLGTVSVLIIANTAPDAFDRIVADIAAGSAAERNGDRKAMRIAGEALSQEGASPVAGSSNAAERWFEKSKPGRGTMRGLTAPYRNRALGAGYRMIALAPGTTTAFNQIFLAGQRARVAVVPLTKSEFSLSVHDDDGQPVCTTTPNTRQCDWVPAWTTRYVIRVANPGTAKSDYYVVMQ